jgi:hypothetical protein
MSCLCPFKPSVYLICRLYRSHGASPPPLLLPFKPFNSPLLFFSLSSDYLLRQAKRRRRCILDNIWYRGLKSPRNRPGVQAREEVACPMKRIQPIASTVAWDFCPVYWPVWMHLGLNKNRFWFLNFEEAPSIWGSHFKFLCISVQSFSEILRISKKDWHEDSVANPSPRTGDSAANPSQRIGDSVANHSRRFFDSLRNIYTLKGVSQRTANQKSTKIGEPQAQLPILLWDSKNLRECLAWNASELKIIIKSKEHH